MTELITEVNETTLPQIVVKFDEAVVWGFSRALWLEAQKGRV